MPQPACPKPNSNEFIGGDIRSENSRLCSRHSERRQTCYACISPLPSGRANVDSESRVFRELHTLTNEWRTAGAHDWTIGTPIHRGPSQVDGRGITYRIQQIPHVLPCKPSHVLTLCSSEMNENGLSYKSSIGPHDVLVLISGINISITVIITCANSVIHEYLR